MHDVGDIHAALNVYAKTYFDFQKLRIMTNNRSEALKRDGFSEPIYEPVEEWEGELKSEEKAIARRIEKLVKEHPMADWVQACPGLGFLGFALIVGETGSLCRYDNPAKLWAYLGMHVMGGMAPKKVKGQKAKWSQRGRMVCHQIGDSVVKLGRGKYREAYDFKKAEYLLRERIGPSGCPMGQEHKNKDGKVIACIKQNGEPEKETSAHVSNAAMRYAVKKMLADMWGEWNKLDIHGGCDHSTTDNQLSSVAPAAD